MMKTKTIVLLLVVVLVAATVVQAGGYVPVVPCENRYGVCIHTANPCIKFDYSYHCAVPGTACCVKRHYG